MAKAATAVQELREKETVEAYPVKELVKEQVFCQRCGSGKVHRAFREGFLQKFIYPFLGFYPWRCTRCGYVAMLHKRRKARLMNSGARE